MFKYNSLQEVFDKVYETVTVKGMNSRNLNARGCSSYIHNPNGCFIGMLLPSEVAERLEKTVYEVKIYIINIILAHPEYVVFAEVAQYFSNLSDEEINALADLQAMHDLDAPTNWKQHLITFAIKHGLTIQNYGVENV